MQVQPRQKSYAEVQLEKALDYVRRGLWALARDAMRRAEDGIQDLEPEEEYRRRMKFD